MGCRERLSLVAELDDLKAKRPPAAEDPKLLEALPRIPVSLVGVPEDRQCDLFAALALVIRYRKIRNEAELSVVLTDRLVDTFTSRSDQPESGDALLTLPRPPTSPPGGGR
jgi:hypothetical protein